MIALTLVGGKYGNDIMYHDRITGAFHFQGNETEDALKYVWALLMDLSFKGRLETVLRIIFKRPPNFVNKY